MPEPKKRYTDWHYGDNGIKQAVEGWQIKGALQPKIETKRPSLALRVARILKENLQFRGFNNCEPWEIGLVEEFIHSIFIENNEAEKEEK